jgi:bifunctional non-homologous end joining protein LigD
MGPPYELGVKRAAFEVEDHPIDYMNFEGTIPKGQYGGGTVMVWDTGTYELLGGSHEKGDLKLMLHGKKLKGEWHIFRIKSDQAKPMWLLAKSKVPAKPMTPRQDDMSVLTRRSMARIASDNDAQWQSNRSGETTAAANVSSASIKRMKKRPPARRSSKRRANTSRR